MQVHEITICTNGAVGLKIVFSLARRLLFIFSSATRRQAQSYKATWRQVELGSRRAQGGVMNRKLFGALVLMAVALVVNVNAQSKARADVPFDFVVGDRVLPAATYDISEVASHAIAIRDFKNGNGTMIQFQPADGKEIMHAKLVFHKYDDRYFLYQVRNIEGQGIQVRESKREREERELASNPTSAPQEVVVALR